MELSDVDKAWLASAIDGEGSIYIVRFRAPNGDWRLALQLRIFNKNLNYLNKAKLLITGARINIHDKQTQTHSLILGNAQLIAGVCKSIEEYLIIKSKQAKLAIEFANICYKSYEHGPVTKEQVRVAEEMRLANGGKRASFYETFHDVMA